MSDRKPEVNVENNGISSTPVDDPRVQALTGVQIIKVFRDTAQMLDLDLYDMVGGGGSVNLNDLSLYHGLIWLKKRADKEGLIITPKVSPDDLTDEQKLIRSIFDGMHQSYVIKILNMD